PLKERIQTYQEIFLETLQVKTTPKKHTDVLMHMLGYFKKKLSSDEKQELLEIIEHFKQGLIPLIVPITLFHHYVRKYDQPYLKNQVYLQPHPLELKLRNHV
ncbi:MAG TPA: YbgA family protein, partial [Thermodesulfobacteriota bacterium]|nr:YbgA family protein [Thermodesulfobacteriota bacterium]